MQGSPYHDEFPKTWSYREHDRHGCLRRWFRNYCPKGYDSKFPDEFEQMGIEEIEWFDCRKRSRSRYVATITNVSTGAVRSIEFDHAAPEPPEWEVAAERIEPMPECRAALREPMDDYETNMRMEVMRLMMIPPQMLLERDDPRLAHIERIDCSIGKAPVYRSNA